MHRTLWSKLYRGSPPPAQGSVLPSALSPHRCPEHQWVSSSPCPKLRQTLPEPSQASSCPCLSGEHSGASGEELTVGTHPLVWGLPGL